MNGMRLAHTPHAEAEKKKLSVFVTYYFLVVLAIGVGVMSRTFLPPNYSYDGNSIQSIAQGRPSYEPDASYSSAGFFFRLLGLANVPWLIAPLGVLFAAVVIWVVNREALHDKDSRVWFISVVTLFLSSVYLSWYSKDLITLLFLTLFFFSVGNKKYLDVLILFTYALIFRQYWFAIGGLYACYRLFLKDRIPNLVVWFSSVLVLLFAVVVAYSLVTGKDVSLLRESINLFRIGSIDAKTIIHNPLEGSGALFGFLNSTVIFFYLLIPVPLVALGQITYFVAAAVLATIWITFILRLKTGFKQETSEVRQRKLLLSSLVFSVLIVGSLFEPDYGSFLRHLVPLLPFVAYIVSKPKIVRDIRISED
jgi:hypothetical protein